MLQKFSFKIYLGGVILVKASVKEYADSLNFILDTGCGGMSLDSTTCSNYNIPAELSNNYITGIAGKTKVSYVYNKTLVINKLLTDSLNFFVNDYSVLTSVYGQKIDGIIGHSFFEKYIVSINYDSSYIEIYSKGKFNYPQGGAILRPDVNKLISQNVTIKEATKIDGNFYLDSGAGLSLLLTTDFIKDNNFLLKKRKPVDVQVQGLGGKKTMQLSVIKSIKIGPYKFNNVPTNIYTDENNLFKHPSIYGLIGNEIMRRFNTIYNYAAGTVHIVPNTYFFEKFDYAYTGLTLYNFDGVIYVDDIIKTSPAEKAGLQNGDVVFSVNNIVNGNIQQYELLLQKANEPIKMIVDRDGKLIVVFLKPINIR